MARFALALVLLVACSDDQPCDGVASACVVVGVSSAHFVAIDELELDISYGDFHETMSIGGASDGPTQLPVITAIELAPDQPVIVSVVGAGKLAGALLGVGFDETAPLLDNQRAMLALRLEPIGTCTAGGTYCGNVYAPGSEVSRYRCEPGRVPILVQRCAGTCTQIADGDARCDAP